MRGPQITLGGLRVSALIEMNKQLKTIALVIALSTAEGCAGIAPVNVDQAIINYCGSPPSSYECARQAALAEQSRYMQAAQSQQNAGAAILGILAGAAIVGAAIDSHQHYSPALHCTTSHFGYSSNTICY